MKNINTSLFDFPTLRDPTGDYVYVDKTAQIYEIAKPSADRNYAAAFADDPRPVYYVGVNYNPADGVVCEKA